MYVFLIKRGRLNTHNVRYLHCIPVVFLSFIGGLVNKRKLFTVIFDVFCYLESLAVFEATTYL